MNWLKKLFGAIVSYFRSGRAAKDTETALKCVKAAAPYVAIVGDIATKYLIHTPEEVDDEVWARIKAALPVLFDGKEHSNDEIKAGMLRALGLILQSKFPQLEDLSVAMIAAQLAYVDNRAVVAGEK